MRESAQPLTEHVPAPMCSLKVSVLKNIFLKALSHFQNVVQRRPMLPALSHILLQAKGGRLTLIGTDLENSLVLWTPADVDAEGAVALPFHVLHDVVRKLSAGPIDLFPSQQSAFQFCLRSSKAHFFLPLLPLADFPPILSDSLSHTFQIESSAFKTMMAQTRFAMSQEEARYALSGLYLHWKNNRLIMAATDAHRLAVASVGWETLSHGPTPSFGALLGRKAVSELFKMLDEPGVVTVSLSENRASFSLKNAVFTTRLVDGTFPDYEAAVPKTPQTLAWVDRKCLQESVERVSMVAPEKNRFVRLKFKRGTLSVSAQSSEHGSAVDTMDARVQGPELEISLNPKYLTDLCDSLEGVHVLFSLNNATTPVLISDPENAHAYHVLMPMRS